MKNEPKKNRSGRKYPGQTSRSDKLNAITKKLEDSVKELFTSENYKNYLRTMSKFHRYSFNNTLLIAMQSPGATLVAGYGAWQQKFHRQVKKGEKGITLLAPVPIKAKSDPTAEVDTGEEIIAMRFRPVTVFDVAQTEGELLPSLGVDELTGSAEGYAAFMQALTNVSPVPIRFDEIEGGAKGYYHNADKEIVIQSGMSELQTLKTCIHEISHAMLHDHDYMKSEGIKKDRRLIEQEAESIAFCVCSRYSLDTSAYSFPYIADFAGSAEMKDLKASMDTIRETAGRIIDGIEAEMEKQQEHSQDVPEGRSSVLAALSREKEHLQAERAAIPANQENLIADLPRNRLSGKELVR